MLDPYKARQFKPLFVTICLLISCLSAATVQASQVVDIRLWRAPDNTRIVFDLDSAAEHTLMTLSKPDRIVIDLPRSTMKADYQSLSLANTPIKRIRSAIKKDGQLRIVLDLKQAVREKSFFLPASADKGNRLVLDLSDIASKSQAIIKSHRTANTGKRDIIIAIDPGHGGEDPGALGPWRIREKNVVLSISKALAKRFDQEKGYKATLIRGGDYYVDLRQRRDLARKQRADLFISVHADAFTSPKAHGSSVYTLSSRGASSTAAKYLANKENDSDKIGGVDISSADPLLSSVLIDMSMNHKMESSVQLGSMVLKEMGKISRLHSPRVEKAAFAVLKTPDIPSILVETGFISNPPEAKRLNSRAYQEKMAKAIFTGVTKYFDSRPPDGTYIAWTQRDKDRSYRVVNGDTLSEIALRYNVPISRLRRHNGIRGNDIRIGQRLKIPSS